MKPVSSLLCFMSIMSCPHNFKMVAYTSTECGYLGMQSDQNDWHYK